MGGREKLGAGGQGGGIRESVCVCARGGRIPCIIVSLGGWGVFVLEGVGKGGVLTVGGCCLRVS